MRPESCLVPGCGGRISGGNRWCYRHAKLIPYDLKERLRWATAEGGMEREAAISAVIDYLEDS
jgi:hypothetical protein